MMTVIDVRTPKEFQKGHAQNAINIPVDQLAIQLTNGLTLDTRESIIVYCASGGRAGVAKTLLERAGYLKVTNAGGLSNIS